MLHALSLHALWLDLPFLPTRLILREDTHSRVSGPLVSWLRLELSISLGIGFLSALLSVESSGNVCGESLLPNL